MSEIKNVVLLTPITINRESVMALGLVSAYYSVFESYLDLLLWNLLELPDSDMGHCITAPMNSLRKLEMFERLIDLKLTDEKEIETAKTLRSECKKFHDDRNNLIHAHWAAYSSSTGQAWATKVTASNKLKSQQKPYTPKEIRAVAQDGVRIVSKISDFFLLKYGERLPGNFQFLQ